MDIFKKIVEAGQNLLKPEFKNPDGLEKPFIELLTHYISLVNEIDGDLGNALLRFVIDATDDEALLKLQAKAAAAEKLGYSGSYQRTPSLGTNRREKIFEHITNAPPQVWVRLAQVLGAAKAAVGGVNVSVPPGWPYWLVLLLMESQNKRTWSLGQLEEVLRIGGLPTDFFMTAILSGNGRHIFHWGYFGNTFQGVPDLGSYIQKYWPIVKTFLATANAEERVYALQLLAAVHFDSTPIIETLVELGTGNAKAIREGALPLLRQRAVEARPIVEKILREADAATRQEAVRVIGQLYATDCQSLLEQQLQIEKSARVKQVIQNVLSASAAAINEPTQIELPPLQCELGEVKVPEQFQQRLLACINQIYTLEYEQKLKQWQAPNRPGWVKEPSKPALWTEEKAAELVEFVEKDGNKGNFSMISFWRFPAVRSELLELVNMDGVKLIHFVRLMRAMNIVNINGRAGEQTVWWSIPTLMEDYRSNRKPAFGLRELDAVFATLAGGEVGVIANSYLTLNSKWQSFCDWEADAVWPLFAEHPEILRRALQPQPGYDWGASTRRANIFKVLAMFPQVPADFLTLLWELALGEGKSDRYQAQAALNAVPGKLERSISALADGRQTIRAAAAEWLGKIGDKSAVAPLKAAFLKEKSEVTKGAILLALDALHADVEEFLDRKKLLEEAKAGLAKKLPKGMEWVPLDHLPKLQWQDSGKEVDANIVKWWVVQSIQQKSPSCGPLVRRYLAMCKPADATNLSKFILSSWIGRDTTTMSVEDSSAKAQAEADKMWNQYATYYQKNNQTKEHLYKQLLTNYQNTCLYSAIDQKGMLALACAHGDGDCVKMCEKFIRHHYGTRLAQCKALIEVLSWIEHPLALQTMLSIANRFRTKSIKEMAQEHVQSIADRQGWTIDELADRTIPDGGFARPVNEEGEPVGDRAVLELDYGPRQFELQLNDELEPVIFLKDEKKPVKALPVPGKNDDEEKAKAAKKEFSDAKKIVKEVVKRQTERLYEAMCTQRSWQFSDWRTYLAAHPIVGRLCVRLVWAAFKTGENQSQSNFLGCFRPLEDGSFTNEKDESVSLPDDAAIFLAHSCNTSSALGQAWLQHLKDYDVNPLFQQFGRASYVLPGEKQKATEVTDFEGHMLTTFKLRGKATKLGFVRGEVEDGGCFCVYRKPFSSLALQAVIEFSGSYVPEEDMPAALQSLYFENIPAGDKQAYWNAVKLTLGKVPPVLLSECYNDFKQIAAEGSGFDPKWREKGLF